MGSYEKIVETLRRCAKENDCDGCPYYHEDGYWCDQKSIATDAADAIETLLATNAWNEEAVKHLKTDIDKRVEVIRCKDCRYYMPDVKVCVLDSIIWSDNGFCSFAKRKERQDA